MLLMLAFPRVEDLPINATPSITVLAFALGLSLLTGLLFGGAPAWIASHAGPVTELRNIARHATATVSLLQRSLVIVQVGLSLVLLIGAGLFLQSLIKLETKDLKLDARNRYIVHINPQAAGYTQVQLDALRRTLEEQFHAIPGVLKVGLSSYTPMEDNNNGWGVQVQGQPFQHVVASVIHANEEYFDSVGTHVVMGRGISALDAPGATPVAVVNRSLAKKLFGPGENPIGHHIGSPGRDSPGDFEIVGVVDDTAYTSARWNDHAMYFVPTMQRSISSKVPIEKDESLYIGAMVIETERPMSDMEKLVRVTLAGINPNLTVMKFQTFGDQIADRFTSDRMITRLSALFGILALLLATVGLYGVTAYSVVQRTPEIGIRMAFGAERAAVIGMVLRGAMTQAIIGLAIGLPIALFGVRLVKSQLYETTNADFRVMASAIAILAVAAFFAGVIPARRAASIDPVRALRMD